MVHFCSMMKCLVENFAFLLLSVAVFSGILAHGLQYDHAASIECLREPLKPQYGGGIVRNPEFNDSLTGWSAFGYATTATRTSATGNQFAVASSRDRPHQSVSQKIHLHKGLLYTFSAWVQLSGGNATVQAVFKTGDDFVHAGAVEAKANCWTMLKGGLSVAASGPAEFYFESENTEVEIWVDSVSLQPFTEEEWRSHQSKSIQEVRTKLIRIRAVDIEGNAIPNATISIEQNRPGFPFGCAMASTILGNTAYQNWFTSRFAFTTFENEMKWYSTEAIRGKEDYGTCDAMVDFAQQHGISIRGHNILWDDSTYQMDWERSLSTDDLWNEVNQRINSVVNRYKGKVIAWDVVNENLHFSFYEKKLDNDVSANVYEKTRQIDPNTLMFLNDFNTLEQPGDSKATPSMYFNKLKEIQSYRWSKGEIKMAIGLESHFDAPNIAYMRSALDTLAGANVPIWLTEVDVSSKVSDSDKAQALEQILREGFSHPAVQGIIIWGAWRPEGCYRMCLTDNNFNNLPTGDVVDKLIGEWKSSSVTGITDADGFFETQLFHGEYEMRLSHATTGSQLVQNLMVDAKSQQDTLLRIEV